MCLNIYIVSKISVSVGIAIYVKVFIESYKVVLVTILGISLQTTRQDNDMVLYSIFGKKTNLSGIGLI